MRRIALAAAVTLVGAVTAAAAPRSPRIADMPSWVREAAETKPPETLTSKKAIVLLDETTVTGGSADAITTRRRQVVKITGAAGRDDYNFIAAYFDRDTRIYSMHAWAIDPKGIEYEAREKEAVEFSPYDGELYSDMRGKTLRIPGVDIGSIVAYEITQSDRAYHLQSTWRFQGDVPVALARFAVTTGSQPVVHWTHYDAVEPVRPGVWELHDVPAIEEEPGRPSMNAIAGRMSINLSASALTWADIGKWYAGLAFPRNTPTPELQAKVRELAPKGASIESIRALARFAQRDVRYVAVEIGIGGYQPHAAGDIFRTRNGDCKDKATLLRTMLAGIGVESHYVLVNTTRGLIDPSFATSSLFNHAILAVRVPAEVKGHAIVEHPSAGRLMLFDPTSTTTPFGYLPPYLQASRGLLVTNDGGDLIALPAHAPDANQLRRSAKLQLDAAGTLSGHVDEIRTGGIASEMRGTLQSLSGTERARFMESVMAQHFTHYTIGGLAVQNLDDVDSDLVISYDITAPGYVKRVADMMLVRPRVMGQKPETIVDMAERKNGYVTDGPSVQTDEIEIKLPPAVAVDELPPAVTVNTPALEYSSKSEFEAGVLHYRRRYALQTFFVPKEKIPELNKAFSQILADERASAVLK
jgi:hypothetical protein